LKPGTRVVIESFPVPGWKSIETRSVDYKTFYLYRMPPEIEEKSTQEGTASKYPEYGYDR
jgi:hypothetical protein